MSPVGECEVRTQRRVAAFFRDAVGYAHLGDRRDRPANANVEEALLTDWLKDGPHRLPPGDSLPGDTPAFREPPRVAGDGRRRRAARAPDA